MISELFFFDLTLKIISRKAGRKWNVRMMRDSNVIGPNRRKNARTCFRRQSNMDANDCTSSKLAMLDGESSHDSRRRYKKEYIIRGDHNVLNFLSYNFFISLFFFNMYIFFVNWFLFIICFFFVLFSLNSVFYIFNIWSLLQFARILPINSTDASTNNGSKSTHVSISR